MKKLLMCVLVASLITTAIAQEIFEQGKPNDDNYRYWVEYKAGESSSTYSITVIN